MEIIETPPVLLCNAEVLACLSSSNTHNTTTINSKKRSPQNVLTIDFEVAQYLHSTSPPPPHTPALLDRLSQWPLTRAERLMLVNLRPQSVVEFYVIVEECEERFAEDQIEAILAIFK